MSQNKTNEFVEINQRENADEMLCSFGGLIKKLPHSVVKAIEPLQVAAPIPFSPDHLEGLVVNIDGLSPQFNLARALGGNSDTAKYALILETSKGLVRITTDAILSLNASTEVNYLDTSSAMGDIENLINNFDREVAQTTTLPLKNITQEQTHSVLLVKVGHRILGVNGKYVDLIERHKTSIPTSRSNSIYRVITLQDNRLISGISTGQWLKHEDAQPEKEIWSIGYSCKGHTLALTVSEMIGLEPIEQSRFYSLLNGDEVTQWVNHASLGAIEILNPQRILDSQLDTSQTELLQAASDTNSNRKIDDKTSTKNPGIGLNLDSFSLVLPQEMIRSVNAKLAIQNVRSKPFKKAIAAFDLLKISTPSTNPSIDSSIRRAATIQLNNGQSVIFMAQEVYEPNTEQPWLPTPVLPRPLSQMIQGIRINNHHCELLLDPLFMSKMSEQELSNLYETTFCGWHNSY